jgi:hypothetical protein
MVFLRLRRYRQQPAARTSGLSTEHSASSPRQEDTMGIRNLVLAFAVAAVTASTPALAAGQHHRAGFNAYGAAPAATDSVRTDRATALRECNAATSSMRETTWGVQIGHSYRACMERHGQPE